MKYLIIPQRLVPAVLEGKKTAHRTIITEETGARWYRYILRLRALSPEGMEPDVERMRGFLERSSPVRPGTYCYVPEDFSTRGGELTYRIGTGQGGKWKPASQMSLKQARIFIRIDSVRAERVQDVTDRDILQETPIAVLIPCLHMVPSSFGRTTCMDTGVCAACSARGRSLRELYAQRYWNPCVPPIMRWENNPWTFRYVFELVPKAEAMVPDWDGNG